MTIEQECLAPTNPPPYSHSVLSLPAVKAVGRTLQSGTPHHLRHMVGRIDLARCLAVRLDLDEQPQDIEAFLLVWRWQLHRA
jgi:hypothetical protein